MEIDNKISMLLRELLDDSLRQQEIDVRDNEIPCGFHEL